MDKAVSRTAAVEKTTSAETSSTKIKPKNRGKKRKRRGSDSSSDGEGILPENTLEMEQNLHASAVKNNLDDISVRKILKKVVTNDHVLALVKLREEEEDSGAEDKKLCPKLTRAKVRELMKVSPKSTAWNLENMELTPIKHIPVKTRPEVKALIAQELPEDEDDDEYKPTHEDVQSDDDQTIESCSDVDSQPRTPATPKSQRTTSPKLVTDGLFKVPQDISTQARRKLELEEVATIALRTRSKLSLSSTSIEHIESTFVPPDDLPMPAVDDLWNEFLNECLNPASTSKNEDDDDADPEYNVAADADAHDEDEEALSNSIIKISKKELNDLVTELFSIMPEVAVDEKLAENLANSVLTDNSRTEVPQWEGKQEPISDSETTIRVSDRLTFEKRDSYSKFSVGKIKPDVMRNEEGGNTGVLKIETPDTVKKKDKERNVKKKKQSNVLNMCIEETEAAVAPPALRHLALAPRTQRVQIQLDSSVCMTREQVVILQQQLRQHVQVATSNFLQLYVHPIHWKLAPTYKEYLESLLKMTESNPSSVVNVCNLKPAVDLVRTWEKTLADDTPENAAIVEFIQSEAERSRRRYANNSLYIGEFHETVQKVIANSPVFLYPYLLPSMPYRADNMRRFSYLPSEDELITLGMEQFWRYVESNPQVFKPRRRPAARRRWGLAVTLQLVVRHMLPWLSTKTLLGHLAYVRSTADHNNPINKFLKTGEVAPVKHKLLPFNPNITLYEQPEHEVPRIWLRYLAKTSKRFRNYLYRRHDVTGREPTGVPIDVGISVDTATKNPLPIDFTKEIICTRANMHPRAPKPVLCDKFDVNIDQGTLGEATIATPPAMTPLVASNLFRIVETSTGSFLVPLQVVHTATVNTNTAPISTPAELKSTIVANDVPNKNDTQSQIKITQSKRKLHSNDQEHCQCCILLRKICKVKQTLITDYFKSNNRKSDEKCDCNRIKYPKVSNRLKLLINMYKSTPQRVLSELETKLKFVKKEMNVNDADDLSETETISNSCSSDELAYVTSYQLKLIVRTGIARNTYVKKRLNNLFSKFDLDADDPIVLANELFKAFDVEMVDLYMEFLGFLTAEQAHKMEVFGDYFTRCCVNDLINKIEELVPNKAAQGEILSQLNGVLFDNVSSPCELCGALLAAAAAHPRLARCVFALFPHRRAPKCDLKVHEKEDALTKPAKQTPSQSDKRHDTVDYEADHSSSGEDTVTESVIKRSCTYKQPQAVETIKIEVPNSENSMDATEFIVSNSEVPDSCESDTHMVIMSDEDYVKTEGPEWKRDEDKLILEILQQYLTPEERKDKTIIELLEEKNVYQLISESLLHKSMNDVRERILYLLQILVLSES